MSARDPASAVGCGTGRRPSGPRDRRARPARSRQPGVPAGALGRAPGGGDPRLFDRFRAAFHVPETHAHILGALTELIDERHAQFNGTLYQLEPDVKDAPGGAARSVGGRTIATLTDPALLRRAGRSRRGSTTRRTSCCAFASMLHLEQQPQPERAEPRAAGTAGGRCSAIPGESARSASSG